MPPKSSLLAPKALFVVPKSPFVSPKYHFLSPTRKHITSGGLLGWRYFTSGPLLRRASLTSGPGAFLGRCHFVSGLAEALLWRSHLTSGFSARCCGPPFLTSVASLWRCRSTSSQASWSVARATQPQFRPVAASLPSFPSWRPVGFVLPEVIHQVTGSLL